MYKRKQTSLEGNKIIETLMAQPVDETAVSDTAIEAQQEAPVMTPEEEMAANVELLNTSVENVGASIRKLFVNSEYFNTILERLHSSNWNNLTVKERKQIFLEIQGYVNYVYGDTLVSPRVAFTEKMVDQEYVYMEFGDTYIYDKVFESKNAGLSILTNYIRALSENIIVAIGDNMYQIEVDPELLSPLALEYYENMQSSYLKGSWTNFLSKGDKYYYNQPIVNDSLLLSKEVMMEHIKYLYSKYDSVDAEMSNLINQYMNEANNRKTLAKKRKEAVMAARKQIKASYGEVESYYDYLEQSASVFSKLSDDEFYELFNIAYVPALNSNEDGLLTKRIDNMLNELPRRVFKEFDLRGIELPKYKTVINEELGALSLGRAYEGEASCQTVYNCGEALTVVLQDMVMLAQKHVLFKFNSEKEREDYMTMKEWTELKNRDYSSSVDSAIVKDGLNIILRKTNELFSDLNDRIKVAISKSKYLPHGKSMISHDNKEALYDYHEFKNLLTKDEVTEQLMAYIRGDIKRMKASKRNGGRK